MLQPQTIPVVFKGGLSGKTDPKVAVLGRLLTLQNVTHLKEGSYEKRYGHTALSANSSGTFNQLSNILALSVFNNDLIATSDTKLYSWSPSADKWFEKSDVTSVSATVTPVIRNSFQQSQVDTATNQGVQVTAYKDSRGGIYAVVSDAATGAFILNETQLNASGDKPSVRACGNFLYVFYVVSGSLRCRRLNPVNAVAFDSEVSLVSDVHATNGHYDVVVSGAAMIVAYNNTTPVISVMYVTQVPAVGSALSGFPAQVTLAEAASNCIGISLGPTVLFIGYHNGTNGTRVTGRNLDLTQAFAPATLDATTSPITQNITSVYNSGISKAQFFYEVNAAAAINTLVKAGTVTEAGAVVAGTVLLRSVGLASKAFVYNNKSYTAVVFESTLQGTAFLIRDDGFINAKYNSGVSAGLVSSRHLPQTLSTSDASVFSIPNLLKSLISAENGKIFSLTGVGLCTIDFGSDSTFQNARLGDNLHFATGILQAYDGFSAIEHGFHQFPEGVTTSIQAGGAVPVGTRSYKVVYEWIDNQGQIHRSAPSPAVSGTTSGGNQTVRLTIPTLRLTAKRGVRTNVTIGIYATTVSPAGTIYYKLNGSSPLYNDPAVDSVTYDDAANDSITGNEILYTTGGVLENIAPPSCTVIVKWGIDRLVLGGLENRTLWISKPFKKGESVNFSDALEYPIDVTALGVLNDKLILFRPSSMAYMAGTPPNAAGDDSSLSDPIEIPSDTGCPYPNSVVTTPLGVFYKSNKGIYLLTSKLEPIYIGADVEPYNNLTIESAVLVEDTNEVRFSTKEGTTLIYNTFFNEWYVSTGLPSFDAVVWQSTYTLLRSNSVVWTENKTTRLDAGQHVALRIGTSWLSIAGLQGFQRVWRILGLGDYKSQHKLRISLAYDFEPYFSEVDYFDTETGMAVTTNTYGTQSPYGTGNYGGNGSGVYQFRKHLARQKCQSFMVLIEDVPNSNPGEAYSFTGLSLECGVKKGAYKLPAAKSI